MNETPATSDAVPVTDHRPVPRGVLPRGMQTWLMVGVAVGMIAIILFAGRPNAPPCPGRRRDHSHRRRTPSACATIRIGSEPPRLGPLRRHKRGRPVAPPSAPAVQRRATRSPARGSDRRRPQATRVREPVREQRRAQSPPRRATSGRRPCDSGRRVARPECASRPGGPVH